MKHTHYSFTTVFTIQAPVKTVWDGMLDYEMWPKWWKGLKDIQLIPDPNKPKDHKLACKVGFALYILKFQLTLDEMQTGNSIRLLSSGDLKGTGIFTFSEKDGITTVTFTWEVETTKAWMNLLSPIGRPIFSFLHNRIMDYFAKGLAKHLHATLLAIHHS